MNADDLPRVRGDPYAHGRLFGFESAKIGAHRNCPYLIGHTEAIRGWYAGWDEFFNSQPEWWRRLRPVHGLRHRRQSGDRSRPQLYRLRTQPLVPEARTGLPADLDRHAAMKTALRAATKAQRERWSHFQQIGCVACHQLGYTQQPADVHHLLSGGHRIGHDFTIPLCPWHHRGVTSNGQSVAYSEAIFGPSLARSSKAFHARFGSDEQLYAITGRLLFTLPTFRRIASVATSTD